MSLKAYFYLIIWMYRHNPPLYLGNFLKKKKKDIKGFVRPPSHFSTIHINTFFRKKKKIRSMEEKRHQLPDKNATPTAFLGQWCFLFFSFSSSEEICNKENSVVHFLFPYWLTANIWLLRFFQPSKNTGKMLRFPQTRCIRHQPEETFCSLW